MAVVDGWLCLTRVESGDYLFQVINTSTGNYQVCSPHYIRLVKSFRKFRDSLIIYLYFEIALKTFRESNESTEINHHPFFVPNNTHFALSS